MDTRNKDAEYLSAWMRDLETSVLEMQKEINLPALLVGARKRHGIPPHDPEMIYDAEYDDVMPVAAEDELPSAPGDQTSTPGVWDSQVLQMHFSTDPARTAPPTLAIQVHTAPAPHSVPPTRTAAAHAGGTIWTAPPNYAAARALCLMSEKIKTVLDAHLEVVFGADAPNLPEVKAAAVGWFTSVYPSQLQKDTKLTATQFWNSASVFGGTWQGFAKFVLRILSIPATEAECERELSQLKLLIGPSRWNLTERTLDSLVQLRYTSAKP
jgi:hypothetical protein